jgi:hypothetical protein
MDSRDRDSSGQGTGWRRSRRKRRFDRSRRGLRERSEVRKHTEDLNEILGRFCDVICVLESGIRALEAREAGTGEHAEAIALRHGLTLLNEVYTSLDLAIGRARS